MAEKVTHTSITRIVVHMPNECDFPFIHILAYFEFQKCWSPADCTVHMALDNHVILIYFLHCEMALSLNHSFAIGQPQPSIRHNRFNNVLWQMCIYVLKASSVNIRGLIISYLWLLLLRQCVDKIHISIIAIIACHAYYTLEKHAWLCNSMVYYDENMNVCINRIQSPKMQPIDFQPVWIYECEFHIPLLFWLG